MQEKLFYNILMDLMCIQPKYGDLGVKKAILVIAVIVFLVFIFGPLLIPTLFNLLGLNDGNLELYGQLGNAYGIISTLFAALAFVGLLVTLWSQIAYNKKADVVNRFYKMIDFQNDNIWHMKSDYVSKSNTEKYPFCEGSKVFNDLKEQLRLILPLVKQVSEDVDLELKAPDIADIAYAIFYYGAGENKQADMLQYLKDYPQTDKLVDALISKIESDENHRLGRSNPNFMSVYCRNMFRAIKLIDEANCLSKEEKINYIEILKAQLSDAELYVLFFYFLSRFGKKWIQYNYVEKYQLLQDLPPMICDGYNPKDYFLHINFEYEEVGRSCFVQKMDERRV